MTPKRNPDRRLPGAAAERPAAPTVASLLARVPYFASLDPSELRRLQARCVTRTFSRGNVLFEEGEPCLGLLVIVDGRVEVRQVSLRGREQVFHTEGAGACLGEGPLFDGGGYLASAVATEPTRALFLPRADVLALCRRHPDVTLAIARSLARRLRHFAEMVSDLAFRPIPERVARYLLELGSGTAGSEVVLPLTHAQLAARLGTVRELIARALLHLEQTDLIARRRGRIVLLDPERLAALARGEDPGVT